MDRLTSDWMGPKVAWVNGTGDAGLFFKHIFLEFFEVLSFPQVTLTNPLFLKMASVDISYDFHLLLLKLAGLLEFVTH
jgi:hypothetical protein